MKEYALAFLIPLTIVSFACLVSFPGFFGLSKTTASPPGTRFLNHTYMACDGYFFEYNQSPRSIRNLLGDNPKGINYLGDSGLRQFEHYKDQLRVFSVKPESDIFIIEFSGPDEIFGNDDDSWLVYHPGGGLISTPQDRQDSVTIYTTEGIINISHRN